MPTPRDGYRNKAGDLVPGCTTVLSSISTGPNDPLLWWAVKCERAGDSWIDARERSARLGTWIHDALDRYPDPLPASAPGWMTAEEWGKARGDFEAYAEWESRVQPRVIAHEVQTVSEDLQAGGTFDQIVEIAGTPTVLDFKTGKSVDIRKVTAQLAMYAHAAYEAGIVRSPIRAGLILHFSPKGLKPIGIDPEQLSAGLDLFRAARSVYRLLKEFPK